DLQRLGGDQRAPVGDPLEEHRDATRASASTAACNATAPIGRRRASSSATSRDRRAAGSSHGRGSSRGTIMHVEKHHRVIRDELSRYGVKPNTKQCIYCLHGLRKAAGVKLAELLAHGHPRSQVAEDGAVLLRAGREDQGGRGGLRRVGSRGGVSAALFS